MSDNAHSLIAHLSCRKATDAIELYRKAFGAEAIAVHKLPDGMLMHAALRLGDAVFYLGEAMAECGCPSPADLGGSGVTLNLPVDDCDASFKRALDAGCTAQMPPEDMFWGDRYAVVVDPFGHRWSLAQHVREVSPEEIERAGAEFCCKPQ